MNQVQTTNSTYQANLNKSIRNGSIVHTELLGSGEKKEQIDYNLWIQFIFQHTKIDPTGS